MVHESEESNHRVHHRQEIEHLHRHVKRSRRWIAISICLILVLVAIVAYLLLRTPLAKGSSNENTNVLSLENSAVLGDENAQITIYEFSDFSCPFCEAVEGANLEMIAFLNSKVPGWEAPMPKIKEQYVSEGKVKIIFKYFPGHGAAGAAHAVAIGVKEQGNDLFWKFAEKAFAGQNLNDLEKMKELAVSIGADAAKLDAYLESGKYQQQLNDESQMGKNNLVSGTPTFFIVKGNEIQKLEGAQSFSTFQQIIEELL